MAAIQPPAFDKSADTFVAHYDSVRGYIRQEVTRHNLLMWLPTGKHLEVLDFGGGDGRDAIWLAELGHSVVLVDESSEMTDKARAALSLQAPKIRSRIQIIEGNLQQRTDQAQTFDLILSHGVLMYELDNPQGQVTELANRLRLAGVLSLLTKGYDATLLLLADGAARAVFLKNGEFVNRLSQRARAYRFSELETMAEASGLRSLARYGVRVFGDEDRRSLSDVPAKELDAIVAREIQASSKPNHAHRGQMLHLIATKS